MELMRTDFYICIYVPIGSLFVVVLLDFRRHALFAADAVCRLSGIEADGLQCEVGRVVAVELTVVVEPGIALRQQERLAHASAAVDMSQIELGIVAVDAS